MELAESESKPQGDKYLDAERHLEFKDQSRYLGQARYWYIASRSHLSFPLFTVEVV